MKLVLLLIIIILLMINTRETFNNVNNIPAFIINLDDDVERMERSINNMRKMNISNFTRISGVRGNDKERLQKELPFLRFSSNLSKGEIGCASSHIYIWKKMVDEKIPRALILEDDFIIVDNFDELFKKAIKNMPSNGLFYNLKPTCRKKCKENNTPTWVKNIGWGAGAYIITLEGAQKMYTYCNNNIINRQLDNITQNVLKNQGYKLLYHNENEKHKCGGCGIIYSDMEKDENSTIHRIDRGKKYFPID